MIRALAAGLLALATVGAAPAPRPIVIGTSYVMHSAVLGDDRRINIALPDDYADAGRRFPVLFLLDGGEKEDFVHIAGLAQISAAYGQGEEMIVVGIEGVDRRHDLTSPTSVPADRKRAPTSGGAAAYRRFLVSELKPWVAARYRTNGHSALIGESLAGLFTLETYLDQPAAFDDYIAVSPSLWWNGGALASRAAAELGARDRAGKRLYLAFDVPAPPADQAAIERAQQDRVEAALRSAPATRGTATVIHTGEGHGSIYHPAAWAALRALYGKAN